MNYNVNEDSECKKCGLIIVRFKELTLTLWVYKDYGPRKIQSFHHFLFLSYYPQVTWFLIQRFCCMVAMQRCPFLFSLCFSCHTDLLNMNHSIGAAKIQQSFCGDFSVAYIQFMSNYGCQCGREIREAFICPLAWFSIFPMLLSSSLSVQVITALLNA